MDFEEPIWYSNHQPAQLMKRNCTPYIIGAILLVCAAIALTGCRVPGQDYARQLPPHPSTAGLLAMPDEDVTLQASVLAVAAPPAPVLRLTLAWDYPSNEMAGMAFILHASPVATNPLPWPALGSTTNLTAQVDMSAQEQYFYVTASNLWTSLESKPGNFLGVPVPPRLVESSIQ